MKWIAVALAVVVVLVAAYNAYTVWWQNPRVVRGLREDPDGERAQRVMLLTLPSGKALPVNYLREGDTVYAAADFPWWKELRDGGGRGRVLIRGETLSGHMLWFGTLIVIDLD